MTTNQINFTNCSIDRTKMYGGQNGKKIGIIYCNEKYMLKFPPTAKLNKQMNYANFLLTTNNTDCLKALKSIGSRINIQKINTIINNTPYISDTYKEFLTVMISERKTNIIDSALK